MNNFFGIGTGDAFYNKRRHINLVYYSMMFLRLLSKDSAFLIQVKQIMAPNRSKHERVDMMCKNILTDYEISYLNYLKNRYSLSEDEFITILSGETLTQGEVKSPASYLSTGNWELIVQMMYATMLSGSSYQHLVQQFVQDFLVPISSGMRGVRLQSSTFRIISESINLCLDNGKRLFSDLPYIEQYVIKKVG